MIIQGAFKKGSKGRLAGKPYRLDLSLDSVYAQVSDGDPVYSDYVQLPDTTTFHNLYAIVDFDKHNQVVGFTVEGMFENYRSSSMKARLEIDLGIFALRTLSSSVKERIIEYLQEHLPALLDSKGHLTVTGAYA
jgi:hypothetical protein